MRRYLVQKTMAANLLHIVRQVRSGQVGSRKRHALLGCQVALLSLGLLAANSNSENIVERTRKALALRKELLTQYSVQVENQTLVDAPFGKQDLESYEVHYHGDLEQLRRDILSSTRNGVPVDPSEGGRGRGRRFGNFAPELQTDLLTLGDFLRKAEVIGPANLDSGEAIEIKVKPKIPGIHVERGRLWVDPESGMPLRVEMRFGMGSFITGVELTLELEWDPQRPITLPLYQEVKMNRDGFGRGRGGGFGDGQQGRGGGGFPGGGGGFPGSGGGRSFRMETSTTWRDYQWDFEFKGDFFKVEDPLPRTRERRAGNRGPQRDEDPFQEIRIQTPGAPTNALSSEMGQSDEVMILGASNRGGMGPGMSEGQIMGHLLGGRGGFGRGGVRGARIGFSRANRIQGSASAGFSSSALDAKPYSLDGGETPDPDYVSWNSGLSLGGPLPGSDSNPGISFSRRRRSFFFVNIDTSWGQQLQSQYASVPTALERRGDFSETAYRSGPLSGTSAQIFDPSSGEPYANARLSSGQIHPTALSMLEFVPLPNRTDPFLNFLNQQSLDNSRTIVNTRLMYSLSESLRLSGGYNLNRTKADSFNIFPNLGGSRSGRGQNVSLSLNQTFRPGLLHNPRVVWNRNRNETLNPFANQRDISAELGIQNTSGAPIDYGLPTIAFTNYSSLDDGSSSFSARESNQISDSIRWTKAGHFFRVGGEISWNRWNRLDNPLGAGSQTFAGVATSLYADGLPVVGTGYDLADFLLGSAQSSRIQYGNTDHYLRNREFAIFLNDNWRMHSRLTLQWGVRYQFFEPLTERYDRLANLDVAPGFTAAEPVTPGGSGSFSGTFTRALVENDRNNLAPRIALAYRLRSGKTPSVLRANYGVFYPDESYGFFANELISQPPFGFAVQTTTSGTDFLDIQSAFTEQFVEDVANTYAVDPNFRLPAVQTWNLSWQQTLPRNFFLSLGYAGSRGTGLELLRAPNRSRDGQSRIADTAEFLYLTPGASSSFHGLQVLAMRRMRSGFSLNAQYEFGKSLDNAATLAGGNRIVAQNDDDLDSEWGRSGIDQRHRLRLGSFWELPFGDRHRWFRDSGIWKTILSNWFATNNFSANSGRVFTARVLGNQINNSGSSSQASERASSTGKAISLPSSKRSSLEWFNTAAFRLPESGRFGDTGRNTIEGPGSWTLDLNLARSIRLKNEGQRILIVMTSSNLFNHVNFTGLDTVVNSRGFGQVISVGQTRRIQFSFRFMF